MSSARGESSVGRSTSGAAHRPAREGDMASKSSSGPTLRAALSPGKDCLPIEKLEKCLDPVAVPRDLSRHLESCAYCRTELDLLRAFHRDPLADEAEAVRMVAERLRAPQPTRVAPSGAWWKGLFEVRWLSPVAIAMAGMLIAVAVGLQLRHGAAPQLHAPNPQEQEVMRSGSVVGISPSGDLPTLPT